MRRPLNEIILKYISETTWSEDTLISNDRHGIAKSFDFENIAILVQSKGPVVVKQFFEQIQLQITSSSKEVTTKEIL